MTKQLEFAGITRVQTDLDYSEKCVSEVAVTFAFVGKDLDKAQSELVEVIEKAVKEHLKQPATNPELGFDAFADLKGMGR